MYIAMNRFRVRLGKESAFEELWARREIHLDRVPGFVEFHLLRGPVREDYALYASHAVWESKAAFETWTKSEAFRAAHRDAGQGAPLTVGHPEFEGFETMLELRPATPAAA
ncbi:antibiotic biosynthesis monooxygenase [Pseudoxanthobacter sp.]|uniref:antibiotic biosynthesis monooxygenase family protein n=1 Tax=Pseudoxanthobacter sp. TaxID=1925742 RepID=UPI002FE01A04